MENIHLRQATSWDAEEMRDVLVKSQRFTYAQLFSPSYIEKLIDQYYNLDRIMEEIKIKTAKWHGYYVAEMDRRIVGVIGGGMIDEKAAEVYVLYMDPHMRGKGIGTRLLTYFTKIQKHTYGAEEQWVAVAKGNQFGIPFYEARGFHFEYESALFDGTIEEEGKLTLRYKRKI